jgi:hypothetical protein
MILTEQQITERREQFDKELAEIAVPIGKDSNIIGQITTMFIVSNDGNKKTVCGINARILKVNFFADETIDGPFKIDLAVMIHPVGVYVELLEQEVTRLLLKDSQGNLITGICRVSDLYDVKELSSNKGSASKKGLQLVVNNDK